MQEMELNMNDASLKDTPKRVAKMFMTETCKWLYELPPKITTFPNDKEYSWMVIVKWIEINSLCEHHFQPFIWTLDIAYIPKNKIVWLSKFSRVADYYARRPQVQERLTQKIYDFWEKQLETEDIIVRINSEHFCMKLRWVEEKCSNTVTCIAGWVFMKNWTARDEFFNHLKIWK